MSNLQVCDHVQRGRGSRSHHQNGLGIHSHPFATTPSNSIFCTKNNQISSWYARKNIKMQNGVNYDFVARAIEALAVIARSVQTLTVIFLHQRLQN